MTSEQGSGAGERRGTVALVLGTSGGGVGRHVRALAEGLRAAGWDVRVGAPAAAETTFGFAATGARVSEVPVSDRPRPRADAVAVRRLRALAGGVDVVHAHGLRAGGLAALALLAPGPRPPLVVTLHNAAPAGRAARAAYAVLERLVSRRAALVLTVSPDLAERARALGAREVAHALVPAPAGPPPSRDRAAVRAALGVAPDRPLVVTVARLAEQKGLPLLLDAVALLARREPAPLVAVAGDGPLEARLRARVEAEGLPVRLLGRRDDVADLMAAADVVACPSVWEGQPLVVQEALRAGAALVATDVGGTAAVAGDAAELVPYGDPVALAAAVAGLLDDAGRAGRLRERARERAGELPTDADAVSQVGSAYRRLLAW